MCMQHKRRMFQIWSGTCVGRSLCGVDINMIAQHPRRTALEKGKFPAALRSIYANWSVASLRLRSAPSYALHTHLTYATPRTSPAATRRWCSTSMSANVTNGGTSSSCTSSAVVRRTSGRPPATSDTRDERMWFDSCVGVTGDGSSRTAFGG